MVRYEDLVADPRSNLEKICLFLGIDIQEAMLATHEKVRSGKSDSPSKGTHEELKNPVHTGRIGRWEANMDRREIEDIEYLCRAEMQALGYRGVSKASAPDISLPLILLPALFNVGWDALRLGRRIRGRL